MKLKEITKSFQIEPNILNHVFRVMKKQNKTKNTLNYIYKNSYQKWTKKKKRQEN